MLQRAGLGSHVSILLHHLCMDSPGLVKEAKALCGMLSSSSRGLCLSCLKHFFRLSEDHSQPWNPPGYFPPTQSCASSHPLFLSHCFRSSWGSSQPLSVDVFSFCFALIILEEVGGAGGKEASSLLEFLQISSSSLIFQCYFPPLKLLGSLLPWKKGNP